MALFHRWGLLEGVEMNIRLNNPLFAILVNVGSLFLLIVPLGGLYTFYKIPLLLLTLFCCLLLYLLFKSEKGNFLLLILPFISTTLLVITLADQYLSFGLMSQNIFN